MVDNADSDNVDYNYGGHGLCIAMIAMLLMILKQCLVKGTEALVRRRGKGSSMTRTGDDDDDDDKDRSIININIKK